jgi:hypothetical protein
MSGSMLPFLIDECNFIEEGVTRKSLLVLLQKTLKQKTV